MLMTVYKSEQGVIDKVVLTAQGEADAKRLLGFYDQFKQDGSGTGRWGEHGNWTFSSDGTDYPPNSYGTGLKPFEPFPEDVPDLKAGDSVRVIEDDGKIDPSIYTVRAVDADGVHIKDGHAGYARNRVVKVL